MTTYEPTFFMIPGDMSHEERVSVSGQGEDERRGRDEKEDGPAFLFENVMCRLDLS
jgi:hypothetical protein